MMEHDPVYRFSSKHGLDALLGCKTGWDRGNEESPPPYNDYAAPLGCIVGALLGTVTSGGYSGSNNGTP